LRQALGNDQAASFLSELKGGTMSRLADTLKHTFTNNSAGDEHEAGLSRDADAAITWIEFGSIVAANRVEAKVSWRRLAQEITDVVLSDMVSKALHNTARSSFVLLLLL
jgi:hypothetical protein